MDEYEWIQSELFVAVTPLYHFVSDSDDLRIGDNFRILKYKGDLSLPLSMRDVLLTHFQLCAPDFLLWQRAPAGEATNREQSTPDAPEGDLLTKAAITFQVLFLTPAVNLFRLLRLFKAGRLFAGDTFVVSTQNTSGDVGWETVWGQRCSRMTIDYTNLSLQEYGYRFSSKDVAFFKVFSEQLMPVLVRFSNPDNLVGSESTQLEMALRLFSRDEGEPEVDVLNILTAFEALLTNDGNTELAYRLSLRAANLLGNDAEERKKIFQDMKDFYGLRSRLVHGSGFKLKPKEQARLDLVEILLLRDLLRRAILSVMALLLAGNSFSRLEVLLDDLIFDEGKRAEVQKAASELLHMEVTTHHVIQ